MLHIAVGESLCDASVIFEFSFPTMFKLIINIVMFLEKTPTSLSL